MVSKIESELTSTTESEDSCESDNDSFYSGMTEEQKAIVQQRISECQAQFKTYNVNQKNQKLKDVLNHINGIDKKAAELAIESCRGNELLAIKRLLDDKDYKQLVVAMSSGEIKMNLDDILYRDKMQDLREALEFDPDVGSDDEEADEWEVGHSKSHRSTHHHSSEEEEEGSDKSLSRKRSRGSESRHERRVPRLCLDDALIMLAGLSTKQTDRMEMKSETVSEEVVPDSDITTGVLGGSVSSEATISSPEPIPDIKNNKKGSLKGDRSESGESDGSSVHSDNHVNSSTVAKEAALFRELSGSASKKIPEDSLRQLGWSDARIKAFRNREKNPNQYYYRFNDPGEPQATGKWSSKDKTLFLKLIQEKGVDYQWGTFSMQIPGRVGYQCSNYYRQLIKEGVIKDENYSVNEKGKLVFQFRNSEGKSTLSRKKVSNGAPTKVRVRRSALNKDENEERMWNEEEEEVAEESILPDYKDPMTMMPVVKPAISPYGHVMGYDSWVKILSCDPKNTCPFTKMKLTRRSLVKLTSENIDEYRDKIISVNSVDTDLYF